MQAEVPEVEGLADPSAAGPECCSRPFWQDELRRVQQVWSQVLQCSVWPCFRSVCTPHLFCLQPCTPSVLTCFLAWFLSPVWRHHVCHLHGMGSARCTCTECSSSVFHVLLQVRDVLARAAHNERQQRSNGSTVKRLWWESYIAVLRGYCRGEATELRSASCTHSVGDVGLHLRSRFLGGPPRPHS